MIDDSTIALVSMLASVVTTVLGALAGMLTAQRVAEPVDDWPRTWVTLPADVQTWVAEQYAAVELPVPSSDAYVVASLLSTDYR